VPRPELSVLGHVRVAPWKHVLFDTSQAVRSSFAAGKVPASKFKTMTEELPRPRKPTENIKQRSNIGNTRNTHCVDVGLHFEARLSTFLIMPSGTPGGRYTGRVQPFQYFLELGIYMVLAQSQEDLQRKRVVANGGHGWLVSGEASWLHSRLHTTPVLLGRRATDRAVCKGGSSGVPAPEPSLPYPPLATLRLRWCEG
jgi:hypothetical protein